MKINQCLGKSFMILCTRGGNEVQVPQKNLIERRRAHRTQSRLRLEIQFLRLEGREGREKLIYRLLILFQLSIYFRLFFFRYTFYETNVLGISGFWVFLFYFKGQAFQHGFWFLSGRSWVWLGCHLFQEILKCKYFFLILFLDLLSKLSQLRDLFICFQFWLCWVFVAAHGLSLVAVRGGFSLGCLLLLQSSGSRHMDFCSCGCMGLLLHGMWDLLTPGIEPIWHAYS